MSAQTPKHDPVILFQSQQAQYAEVGGQEDRGQRGHAQPGRVGTVDARQERAREGEGRGGAGLQHAPAQRVDPEQVAYLDQAYQRQQPERRQRAQGGAQDAQIRDQPEVQGEVHDDDRDRVHEVQIGPARHDEHRVARTHGGVDDLAHGQDDHRHEPRGEFRTEQPEQLGADQRHDAEEPHADGQDPPGDQPQVALQPRQVVAVVQFGDDRTENRVEPLADLLGKQGDLDRDHVNAHLRRRQKVADHEHVETDHEHVDQFIAHDRQRETGQRGDDPQAAQVDETGAPGIEPGEHVDGEQEAAGQRRQVGRGDAVGAPAPVEQGAGRPEEHQRLDDAPDHGVVLHDLVGPGDAQDDVGQGDERQADRQQPEHAGQPGLLEQALGQRGRAGIERGADPGAQQQAHAQGLRDRSMDGVGIPVPAHPRDEIDQPLVQRELTDLPHEVHDGPPEHVQAEDLGAEQTREDDERDGLG